MTRTLRVQARPENPPSPERAGVPTSHCGEAEVPVDLRRTDGEVVVKMSLGWVAQGSTKVTCAGRSLCVEVERCARDHGAGSPWRGLRTAVLRRTIELPCDVSAALARASYRQGVLTIRLPLAAVHSPVSAAGHSS